MTEERVEPDAWKEVWEKNDERRTEYHHWPCDTKFTVELEALYSTETIQEATIEIARNEADESNSHSFKMGFVAALNFVNKKLSQDEEWQDVQEEVFSSNE